LNHTGQAMAFRITKTAVIGTLVAAVCVAAAIYAISSSGGSGDPGADDPGAANPESAAADYDAALADAPKPLSDLYARANELIPGALDAYEAELAKLEGHPVVVNLWASWCGPCRHEFLFFQRAAAEYGERVAFLGVDALDSDPAAETFLEEFPVPYPSVTDPDREIWNELGLRGLPGTAFYGRDGELEYLRNGPYTSEDELIAEIERYTR
jgi:cytochrome c biogenesis protein CcmG, thiol:disulfide interchange protein DsbE